MPTMTCDHGDIVAVPFPFVDRPEAKLRPALVLSRKTFNASHAHSLLAMITTGSGTSWKTDLAVTQRKPTGLPVPSVIRMKLFTLDNRLIRKRVGRLHRDDWSKVQRTLRADVFAV